jgi:hypothetical protein
MCGSFYLACVFLAICPFVIFPICVRRANGVDCIGSGVCSHSAKQRFISPSFPPRHVLQCHNKQSTMLRKKRVCEFILFISICSIEIPPKVVDASRGLSSGKLAAKTEHAVKTVKQAFQEVRKDEPCAVVFFTSLFGHVNAFAFVTDLFVFCAVFVCIYCCVHACA